MTSWQYLPANNMQIKFESMQARQVVSSRLCRSFVRLRCSKRWLGASLGLPHWPGKKTTFLNMHLLKGFILLMGGGVGEWGSFKWSMCSPACFSFKYSLLVYWRWKHEEKSRNSFLYWIKSRLQCRCLVGAIELAFQSCDRHLDRHVRRWGMGEGKNEENFFAPLPPLSFLLPIAHLFGRTFFLSPVFHWKKNSRCQLKFLQCECLLEELSLKFLAAMYRTGKLLTANSNISKTNIKWM